MPNPRNNLQPFHIFSAEVTRVNRLYWHTGYAYTRTEAMLRAIGHTSTTTTDPRVDALWPSVVDGEKRSIALPFSALKNSLDDNLATLRRTSILYLCSAFEACISAYYILCCLYKPSVADAGWRHPSCPALAGDSLLLAQLKAKAAVDVGPDPSKQKLKGAYSKRIAKLSQLFALQIDMTKIPLSSLDSHYALRHKIAHTQGLLSTVDPTERPDVAPSSTITTTELEWKTLIDDFVKAVLEIDRAARTDLITDYGIALAVARVLEEHAAGQTKVGALRVAQIRGRVGVGWRINPTLKDIAAAVSALGKRTRGNSKLSNLVVE